MKAERFGHMVHEYYVGRLAGVMAERGRRLEALGTGGDARAYVDRARRAVRRAFGPFPERTPLRARVTGRSAAAGFRVENVLFESRPSFLVSGTVYVPEGPGGAVGGRRPAALVLCGHAGPGKAYELYQRACQGLALRGFVVLSIDPIEQGERRQYMPGDGGRRPGLCHAHNLMGNQLVLLDDFFGMWRAWDAIHALDYLVSRPDVDARRVGVTGNSGGGTLTTYVAALDPRPAFVAPSCFVCSYLANVRNELPSDAEQNPPGIMGSGLDQADMLLAYAPRPTLVLSQRDDFFDERYARRAAGEIARVHALLGATGTAEYFAGPRTHGFSEENRQAMYDFFCRQAGLPCVKGEAGIEPLAEGRLRAAPGGLVHRAGSRKVFDITAERARQAAVARGKPDEATVIREARRLLGLPEGSGGAPDYRILWGSGGKDERFTVHAQFAVESEPGIRTIVSALSPAGGPMHPPSGAVVAYIGHLSGLEDLRRERCVRGLLKGTKPLVTIDPRGIGETRALTCGDRAFLEPYGSDYLYAAQGEMLGESYAGRRVLDAMAAVDFLLAGGATSVELVGRGLGAITAAFAALLHPSKPRARLLHYLPSYELLARSPQTLWPLSAMVRGCLPVFDLPDVYRILGRRVRREAPWDAFTKPLKRGRVR